MSYHSKYLKYKNKYISLKNQIAGAESHDNTKAEQKSASPKNENPLSNKLTLIQKSNTGSAPKAQAKMTNNKLGSSTNLKPDRQIETPNTKSNAQNIKLASPDTLSRYLQNLSLDRKKIIEQLVLNAINFSHGQLIPILNNLISNNSQVIQNINDDRVQTELTQIKKLISVSTNRTNAN